VNEKMKKKIFSKYFYLFIFKAMRMALESKYMTLEEMAAYLKKNSSSS